MHTTCLLPLNQVNDAQTLHYCMPEVRTCTCDICHIKLHTFAGPASQYRYAGLSGAGKTTLLHVLAGRQDTCVEVTGTVLVSGRPRSTATFRQRDVTLAEQNQSFTPCLTIAETLDMYCRLQRPGYATACRSERAVVLSTLLHLVGLQAVQHTRVGIAFFWQAHKTPCMDPSMHASSFIEI